MSKVAIVKSFRLLILLITFSIGVVMGHNSKVGNTPELSSSIENVSNTEVDVLYGPVELGEVVVLAPTSVKPKIKLPEISLREETFKIDELPIPEVYLDVSNVDIDELLLKFQKSC